MKKYKHKTQIDFTAEECRVNIGCYIVRESVMNYFQIPKELIENSNDWELITNIEVGKLYKKDGLLILVKEKDDNSEKLSAIGFNFDNKWNELREFRLCFDTLTEATKDEWFERCKEEAIKKGLVKGVKATSAYYKVTAIIDAYFLNGYDLTCNDICLMDSDTGKWATVIEEKAQEHIDLHQKKYSLFDLQEAFNNLKK